MKKLKARFNHYKTALYTGLIGAIVSNESAFASLTELSKSTKEVNSLVTGPLGSAVLIVGTVVGFFGAILSGKVMVAAAIAVIGVLLGIQIDSIKSLFPAA
jgi:hypothetical protein